MPVVAVRRGPILRPPQGGYGWNALHKYGKNIFDLMHLCGVQGGRVRLWCPTRDQYLADLPQGGLSPILTKYSQDGLPGFQHNGQYPYGWFSSTRRSDFGEMNQNSSATVWMVFFGTGASSYNGYTSSPSRIRWSSTTRGLWTSLGTDAGGTGRNLGIKVYQGTQLYLLDPVSWVDGEVSCAVVSNNQSTGKLVMYRDGRKCLESTGGAHKWDTGSSFGWTGGVFGWGYTGGGNMTVALVACGTLNVAIPEEDAQQLSILPNVYSLIRTD